MRLHKIGFALALVLLCARTTNAAEPMKIGFLLDFVNGVSIPISDGDYKNFADPSYKLGVRIGAIFYLTQRIGLAPEAEFDFIPINSNDSTFQRNGIDAQFYRERGLIGGRFLYNFGFASAYARIALGVDHMGGSTSITIAGTRFSTDSSSTGFTFEPGVGVDFNIVKNLVVGFSTGFPISTQDFGNNKPHFTAVDLDFLAVVGLRL
jgi:opacity protein-like surface antigen